MAAVVFLEDMEAFGRFKYESFRRLTTIHVVEW